MMHNLSLDQLAQLVQGKVQGKTNSFINSFYLDARHTHAGALFIALPGANSDGHNFVEQARQHQATAALVEHWQAVDLPQIQVASCTQALAQLAAYNRSLYSQPLVAITGNSGKTTVKEILTAILRAHYRQVLATQGNLNNALGLPLTLLGLQPVHQAAVIEMGANHLGEIDFLARIAQPSLGIITNVTSAHLGEFGSLEAIAQTKAELLHNLAPSAYAILNAEDVFYDFWRSQLTSPHLSFGLQTGDICTAQLHLDKIGAANFTVITPWGSHTIHLPLPGKHNVANALAAIGAACLLGVPLPVQAEALRHLQPVSGRLCKVAALNNATLLDDSYNASPGAVKAAIDVLANFPGKKILALGSLGELGAASSALHQELGRYARQQGVDALFALEGDASLAARAFNTATATPTTKAGVTSLVAPDHESLAAALKPELNETTCVLVKGSRSAAMERLVALLAQPQESLTLKRRT